MSGPNFWTCSQGPTGFDALLEEPECPSLYYPVELGEGRQGLCRLDGHLINALIEILAAAPDRSVLREARPSTRTDAALCRTFTDALLADLASCGPVTLNAPQTGPHAVMAKRLTYALGADAWGTFGGKVSFQGGLRGGGIQVSLPLDLLHEAPDGTDEAQPGWARALRNMILAANPPLRAVLDRQTLPLDRLVALKPGDRILVAHSNLSAISLADANGRTVLTGKLGQIGLKKAVRVAAGPPAVAQIAKDEGANGGLGDPQAGKEASAGARAAKATPADAEGDRAEQPPAREDITPRARSG